jgi:thioredoxin 1
MVIEITKDNFNDVIQSDNLSVIKVGAEWCGPCKVVKPILENMAMNDTSNITYGDIDSENSPILVKELGIRSIPTTFFYRNGEKLKTFIGVYSDHQLKEMVEETNKMKIK